jgi:hypothetical protein
VIVAIALFSALMVGLLAMVPSRAARARTRAQLIADCAAEIARPHPTHLVDPNVVDLQAYRLRRLTSARGVGVQHSQHATR